MRISYKPYLLPTLIFSFMFLSCKSHAELETIITVEQVGAAATPDRIIPIEGAPFEIPQLEGPCAQKDSVGKIRKMILEADMMVFVTPLYYYGMSAQLKTLIDRFCAFNSSIQRKHMKAALLAVAWNDDEWTFEALVSHYKTLVRYLNLMDMGMVLGAECGTPAMTQRSEFPKLAYELGRTLS